MILKLTMPVLFFASFTALPAMAGPVGSVTAQFSSMHLQLNVTGASLTHSAGKIECSLGDAYGNMKGSRSEDIAVTLDRFKSVSPKGEALYELDSEPANLGYSRILAKTGFCKATLSFDGTRDSDQQPVHGLLILAQTQVKTLDELQALMDDDYLEGGVRGLAGTLSLHLSADGNTIIH